jgi:FAD/FMN-containing dehydrogenase
MLLGVDSARAGMDLRDRLIRSVLQPSAIDYISLGAAAELGYKKALLAVEFAGNQAVIKRCQREMLQWGEPVDLTEGEAELFWFQIQNFTPSLLEKFPGGTVVRISTTLSGMCEALEKLDVPVIARAASGVIYAYFSQASAAAKWMTANPKWTSVIEYGPAEERRWLTLWPSPSSEMELMKRVKVMFDPHNLLNRGRYYRHF